MGWKFNPFTGKLDKVQPSAGVSTWLALTDTPSAYTGQAGKFPKVNAGETALDFGSEADLDHDLLQNVGTNTHAQIDSHIADVANPHSVTKTQVGLGNVSDDAQLAIALNLSDLSDVPTARTNLGLGTAATKNTGTAAGEIPILDGSGKLVDGIIPNLAISEYLGNFTDTAAALADAGVQASQRGDWFTVDTSGGLSYIVTTDNPTLTSHITLIKTPTDAVSSVNGKTGVVVINPDDLDDSATTNKFTNASDISKLAGIEALADVTDTANVTAAGALMDSEVDADIKTLVLPANTTISVFGASLIDDADAATARATLGLTVPIVEKSITIESPTATEDITMFFTNRAITVSEMRAVLANGTATPSVTWTIRHSTDRSAVGNEVVTGGTTTTSTTTGSDVTTFNDATIPADSFVWIETTAQSGTVPSISITLIADID